MAAALVSLFVAFKLFIGIYIVNISLGFCKYACGIYNNKSMIYQEKNIKLFFVSVSAGIIIVSLVSFGWSRNGTPIALT